MAHNDDLSVAVVTSRELRPSAEEHDVFDDITVCDDPFDDIRDKHTNLHRSPYDKTLYLDTDTLVLDDLAPVFELLDRYDIAVTHAPFRQVISLEGIPPAFPEVNGGVIAFRDSDAVARFLKQWRSYFTRQAKRGRPEAEVQLPDADRLEQIPFGRLHDQPPLREALYESDVAVSIMPPEYNFRGPAAYAQSTVSIMHMGHSSKAKALASVINERVEPRVYVDWDRRLYFQTGRTRYIGLSRFDSIVTNPVIIRLLKRLGVFGPAKRLYRRLIGATDAPDGDGRG
ncbi:hypothetical protein [Halorientalis marina]|uniref:hypothetical protein n=1 Tax=Halorientalis marina TaxID=2931976 RepID=UPI001FF2B217|nr:hypothetical protein [Halorientalis marina]